ncbi:uncharacterized protein G2W53_001149 [Senna tora]|uniref:Uncharacterized protein n=1 Tax=Senna tora TaxID=362788 RepID=A0A835CJ59_9FABA|nr:uncharacterized protein G2W53_001149 [Senna tora]
MGASSHRGSSLVGDRSTGSN